MTTNQPFTPLVIDRLFKHESIRIGLPEDEPRAYRWTTEGPEGVNDPPVRVLNSVESFYFESARRMLAALAKVTTGGGLRAFFGVMDAEQDRDTRRDGAEADIVMVRLK